MMCRVVTTWAVVALVLAMWSPAAAQDRQGIWAEFLVGEGTQGISAADDSPIQPFDGRDWGGVVGFALGWAVNHRVLVGLELKATTGTILGDAIDWGVLCACGAVWFYPSASNLFVKAGAGGAFLDAMTSSVDETHGGLGLTTGAGYDIHLGRRFFLTPAVGFWYASPGDLRLAGQTFVKGWKHNAVDFTVAIKFD